MSKNRFLKILFAVTLANFAAQIPYYFHQYYVPLHTAPSLIGLGLMTVVLAWFLVGYYGLVKGKKLGYRLTMSFLVVEFLFYLQTLIMQVLSGHGILLHVLHPDGWLLFVVFGIGYINFLAALWFIPHLWKRRPEYLGSSR